MSLVPTDYPDRLAARGLAVNVYGDWSTLGSSADHGAVVIHHTASGATTTPKGDADYCHSHADAAPLYNVLVDRYGVAWVLAREKSNNAGDISGVALAEAREGRADLTPAAVRDLPDTTSNNAALFGVAAQNNGSGEPWGDALLEGVGIACAVALECLGLEVGHVTTHRALTARKIDPDGGNCPDDWHAIVGRYLHGQPATRGKRELMVIEQPNRTVDGTRVAVAELRPDDQQVILWNGASLAGDIAFVPGDDQRRNEARVFDLRQYTNGKGVVGWSAQPRGPLVVADNGDCYQLDWS